MKSSIHSGHLYSSSSCPLLLRSAPDTAQIGLGILCRSFTRKRHRQLQVKDLRLSQGPYLADRAGFEPTTLRLKGIDSTNAPPRPMFMKLIVYDDDADDDDSRA